MAGGVLCAFLLVFLSSATKAEGDTLVNVTLSLGQIIGREETHTLPDGTQSVLKIFRGIPYASPPVGTLRFSQPRPVQPFSEPLEAFAFPPACPQASPVGNMSEDCLFLNVLSPELASPDDELLPVIVWIHGGAFVSGEGRLLPAETLASYGNIIVVTMNFRLGALGFLNTDDSEASGNWGLWDQRLALQWVKEHISHFHGDPENITLAGTTSGGYCVSFQALYPPNEGLFQKIIVESSSIPSMFSYQKSGLKNAEKLAKVLGCSISDTDPNASGSIIACLREKDPESIASATVRADSPFMLTWMPVVDGEFIVKDPSTIMSWPSSTSVPNSFGSVSALTGTVSLDGSIIFNIWVRAMASAMNEDVSSGVSSALFEKVVEAFVSSLLRSEGTKSEDSWMVSQAVIQEYTNWEDVPDEALSRGRGLVDLFTDTGFFVPNVVFTRNHAISTNWGSNSSSSVSSFMYEFHQPSPGPDPFPWIHDGSLHQDHDLYVFGLPTDLLSGAVVDLDSEEGASLWNFSRTVMTYWSNFVKTGNPNTPDPVAVEWPPFTLNNEDYLHLEAEKIDARRHCRARRTSFWLNLVPQIHRFAEELREKCDADQEGPSSGGRSGLLVNSAAHVLGAMVVCAWVVALLML